MEQAWDRKTKMTPVALPGFFYEDERVTKLLQRLGERNRLRAFINMSTSSPRISHTVRSIHGVESIVALDMASNKADAAYIVHAAAARPLELIEALRDIGTFAMMGERNSLRREAQAIYGEFSEKISALLAKLGEA